MTTSLIAFGANLGNRVETFERACQQLSAHEEITVVARSQHHQTSPIGGPAGQEDFLNAAILIDTSLSAQQLLVRLQAIETQLGRRRQQRWDRRPIDLDLLLYDTLTLEDDQLEVPHPHMAFRRFVLEPAVEIAPTLVHPTSGWSIQQLHAHLDHAKNYLALVGPAGSGKTDVARVVCEQLGVKEEEVTPEASFVEDLGADSLDTVELVMALEEEFETEIPDEEAEKITTVKEAIDYIEAHT